MVVWVFVISLMQQKPIGNVARKNWNNRWRSSIKRKIRCTDLAWLWNQSSLLGVLPGQPFDWESPNMLRWIAWVKQQEASLKNITFPFSVTILLNSLIMNCPLFWPWPNIKNSKISSSVCFEGQFLLFFSVFLFVSSRNAGFAFLSVRTRSWWNTSENSKQRSISFNLSSRTRKEIQQHGKGEWWNIAQIIATSAEVTPNGGLVRELAQNPLNSGSGTIVICLEIWGN